VFLQFFFDWAYCTVLRMETYRWVTGLTIAVVFGGLVTQYYARRIKILVGEDNPEYRISIPISIGFVESLFFTIGVAFHLSGVMIAMVAWMVAKMAACWKNLNTHLSFW
jgi:hypothetical protein